MKRGRLERMLDVPWAAWLPGLATLSISFLIGTLAGCLLAGRVAQTEGSTLAVYVEGYLSAARSGGIAVPNLLLVLWETLRWPVLTILLAFTALGMLGIPILFAVRGFLLSFAVASFVRVLGGAGAILAVTLFGLTGLLSIPVLFVLGVQGFTACRVLASRLVGVGERRRISAPYGRAYFLRCALCGIVLFVCVCLEQTVLPSLLLMMAGTF